MCQLPDQPWPNGSVVMCTTDHLSTLTKGRFYKVRGMHRNACTGEWVLTTRNNYEENESRGTSTYFAKWFHQVHKENDVSPQDHYFAPIEDGEIQFKHTEKRPSYAAMRSELTARIKADPSLRYAVWTIASIAETSAPPVVFSKP